MMYNVPIVPIINKSLKWLFKSYFGKCLSVFNNIIYSYYHRYKL